MSGGHLERLEAMLAELERTPRLAALARLAGDAYDERRAFAGLVRRHVDPDEFRSDLRAAVDELNKLRAEREGWLNGASQRLRHAYRSGWDDRGERDAQALMVRGGFHEAEVRAAAYAAEWWDLGAALAAKIEANAAPQQPAPDGGEPT